jgi:hypothetical protein
MNIVRRSQAIDELTASYMRINERVSGDIEGMRVIMASISRTPFGELQQFVQDLHTAGITYEDVKLIRANHDLAIKMEAALREAIAGKLPQMQNWNPPIWWRTPEQQLERARQLWPNVVLPEPPEEFIPRTKSEVLLLHVPDTFDNLWDKVVTPDGYTKYRSDSVRSDTRSLCLAPFLSVRTKPVWLAFDPEHGKGDRPDSFWGRSNLAASEVFSALVQFPDWPLAWFHGASAPNLAGFQLMHNGNWSGVPCLFRWDDVRRLELRARWAAKSGSGLACPTVREC